MRNSALSAVASVLLFASLLSAQQTVAKWQNFKGLPPGLLQQTSQAYRDGKPFGQTVVDTHCAASLTPQGVNAVKQLQATVAPTCSTKVTIDTPTEGESLQTCDPGAMQSVIRTTLTRLDDQTMKVEINMTKGGQQLTFSRSIVKYLGACPAGLASPTTSQTPAIPRPSAEACAQLPEMREQAKSATVESCKSSDFPPEYVARCEASMKIMQQHMQQLEAACKR